MTADPDKACGRVGVQQGWQRPSGRLAIITANRDIRRLPVCRSCISRIDCLLDLGSFVQDQGSHGSELISCPLSSVALNQEIHDFSRAGKQADRAFVKPRFQLSSKRAPGHALALVIARCLGQNSRRGGQSKAIRRLARLGSMVPTNFVHRTECAVAN